MKELCSYSKTILFSLNDSSENNTKYLNKYTRKLSTKRRVLWNRELICKIEEVIIPQNDKISRNLLKWTYNTLVKSVRILYMLEKYILRSV